MNTWTGYIFLTFYDLCCHEKWNAEMDRWLWWVGGAVVPPVYLCPACHRHSRHSRADARHEKTSMATVPIDCYKENFLEATDYRLPFLVDLSLSSNNPHWERSVCLKKENLNLEDAVQQHPDQEPRTLLWAVCQGAWLRTINSKRKNFPRSRLTVQVLEPCKGGGQQMALSPAITRRDDYRLGPSTRWENKQALFSSLTSLFQLGRGQAIREGEEGSEKLKDFHPKLPKTI